MQVVRTGPDVDGDQCPEVDDRQAIGIHRTLGLLRHEVVHDPEEAGGEEEAHGVVAVPPLHHRIGRTGIQRVGLHRTDRNFQVVDDVQNGHGQDEGAEEPVTDVDVLDLARRQRTEEDDRIGHPDDGDQDVDRPLQFRIFLGAGEAQRQGDRGEQNDQLPAPERERGQLRREQCGLTGTLYRVVGRCEQSTAAEGEDHRVGVQWT